MPSWRGGGQPGPSSTPSRRTRHPRDGVDHSAHPGSVLPGPRSRDPVRLLSGDRWHGAGPCRTRRCDRGVVQPPPSPPSRRWRCPPRWLAHPPRCDPGVWITPAELHALPGARARRGTRSSRPPTRTWARRTSTARTAPPTSTPWPRRSCTRARVTGPTPTRRSAPGSWARSAASEGRAHAGARARPAVLRGRRRPHRPAPARPAKDGDFRAWLAAVRTRAAASRRHADADRDPRAAPEQLGHPCRREPHRGRRVPRRHKPTWRGPPPVFKGWLGDRAAYPGFTYGDAVLAGRPEGAGRRSTRKGATNGGRSIDGALPDDMRRGCGEVPAVPDGLPVGGAAGRGGPGRDAPPPGL